MVKDYIKWIRSKVGQENEEKNFFDFNVIVIFDDGVF